MNYILEGDPTKPVLVFSNSLGTSLSMWDQQALALKNDFQILRYDTRGHGGSNSVLNPKPSISDLASDVIELLDKLKIEKAWFCGISLGGLTGLKLALQYPERFFGFILSNTSAKIAIEEIWNNRIQMIKTKGLAPIAQASPNRWFTEDFIKTNPDIIDSMTSELKKSSPEGYCFCCEALAREDLWSEIHKIHSPVLFVAGAFDQITTVLEAQKMQELVRGSQIEVLHANHLASIEKGKEFSKLIRDFIP